MANNDEQKDTHPLFDDLLNLSAKLQKKDPSDSNNQNKTHEERRRILNANKDSQLAGSGLYKIISVVVCLGIIAVLLVTISHLPSFGDPDNPTNNEVTRKYIEEGMQDTGAINLVAAMILDYRALDTFGEACVLFVAICAIMLLFSRAGPAARYETLFIELEEPRQNVILRTTSVLLIPLILLFGSYVVIHGHLSPGGGFSGGAILGAGLILYANAYGTKRARKFINFKVISRIISGSLLFYALAKGYSFFVGANQLPSVIPLGTPGNILSAGLIFPLNISVGLVVACTVYAIYILFSKGELL